MKYIFVISLVVLIVASAFTYMSFPEQMAGRPVLYWVTDNNPVRKEQVAAFEQWQINNGLLADTPDEHGKPRGMIEIKIDWGNSDPSKKIIQGVSGMGGDLIDINPDNFMPFFQRIGILADITDWGNELGFHPEKTYPAMRNEIGLEKQLPDGSTEYRQFMFPCNVFARLLWVNKDTFEQYGLPLPPQRWTFEEFEKRGRQFVEAARDPGSPYQTHFFADELFLPVMYRSLGLSKFNETLTRCTLDDPRYVKVLKLQYKWTYEDRIIPSRSDLDTMSGMASYGGVTAQMFNHGNFAMLYSGRYMLITFRKFADQQTPMNLDAVEMPHGGIPNCETGCRGCGIYSLSEYGKGSEQDYTKYFLQYLASEEYNMQIVRDADALPPNPKYTTVEAFLRPADHPNEWGVHEKFAEAATTIAFGSVHSPFVLERVIQQVTTDGVDRYMNNLITAEEAARFTADRINSEIERNLRDYPELEPEYERLTQLQAEIDQLKVEGKLIPPEMIANPFYKKYPPRHETSVD